jgi:hypothetical protein
LFLENFEKGDIELHITLGEKGKLTIVEAIKYVMSKAGQPLSAREVYERIIAGNLYTFHADRPYHVVLGQIRRHCFDIDYPTASPTKHFKLVGDDKFAPLAQPKRVVRKNRRKKVSLSHLLGTLRTI